MENEIEEGKKPLTIQQRMKIGRRMKRLAPKLVRARKRAAKKMASTEKLMKRAQKAAIKLARKKVAGKKGLAYAKLSPSEKISVDKMVSKRYTSDRIKKIAKKLMPKVRKAEVKRLQLARSGGEKNEQVEKQPLTIQQLLRESGGAGEWGTTKLRNKYASDTPGQVAEKEDEDIKDRPGKQPAKYYAKDAEGDEMSKSTKTARARHFEKGQKKSEDDPSAYKPAPGDKSAKTKPSKYTKKYKQMFGEGAAVKAARDRIRREKEQDKDKHDAMLDRARSQDARTKNMQTEGAADKSLAKKAEKSGISIGILRKVYNRGVAAWRTGHRPGTTPEQWGHARVNSFITGGKTRTTADADLWKKHKG